MSNYQVYSYTITNQCYFLIRVVTFYANITLVLRAGSAADLALLTVSDASEKSLSDWNQFKYSCGSWCEWIVVVK